MLLGWIKTNTDLFVTAIVSVMGSLKAITFTNKHKTLEKVVDFIIGVLCGMLVGYYVEPDMGYIASLIIALFSAVAGVLVLETVMTSIPTAIAEWLKSKVNR